ncbi:PRC-barrel domain-containing protein [Halobacillus shinanisalinarum]|uniref:PRC-barrel domain-containing protein n=1 Tax=Halobacillus shinanisalinarum TaxID=2932258 RepID=A0ABY4H6H6_9BACI|nr:PRC-barrel domain-containing protein [Halobacillus shinanisalinarum]UOQ95192.1 PRC-barrel domain-containing protein [Halobacillus shinanisalinarum]
MYPSELYEENFVEEPQGIGENSEESHIRSTSEVQNYQIHAEDGGIGHVDSFLVDDETWKIRYLIVDTKNWQSGKKVLIAPAWISDVRWSEKRVFVSLDQKKVENAPEYDPDAPISRAYEEKLYSAYGKKPYWKE